MAFCPCPEPYILEILLLFLSPLLVGMCRNGAPSFTTWSWFLSFAQEISQQILAQGWQGCISFWVYFEQSRNPYLKSVIYMAHTYHCVSLDLKKILDHSSQEILKHKLGMIGHLSSDQGETWWQELCLPCCLQCLILHPVFHYILFLCSFRFQHSGFLFTPVADTLVPLSTLPLPHGRRMSNSSQSLWVQKVLYSIKYIKQIMCSVCRGRHWKIVQKLKGSKCKRGAEEPAALFCRTVLSLSGNKSSSDSFITAAISWIVLLILSLLPL